MYEHVVCVSARARVQLLNEFRDDRVREESSTQVERAEVPPRAGMVKR